MATVLTNTQFAAASHAKDVAYPIGVPKRLTYPSFPAWGLLHRAAELLPDRNALTYYDNQWTFAQLDHAAMRLSTVLQQLDVRVGDRVGILLPNVPEYSIAVNGIWRAGGVAVAISPLMVAEEVDRLLRDTDCRVVIALDALAHLLDGQHRPRMTMLVSLRKNLGPLEQLGYLFVRHARTGHWWIRNDGNTTWFWDSLGQVRADSAVKPCDPERDPAYILPTGGTTAEPKAVTLSHRNLVANAWQQYYWAGAQIGKETLMGVLPFFHSYGLSTTVLGGAALGANVILHHRFNVRRVIQLIARHRPTVFHAVPAMLVAMNEQLRSRKCDLRCLKWVISGGAALPEAVGREFAEHTGAIVVEGYGLSESSPVTHVGPLNEHARFGTIGFPLPDTEARIVDQETGSPDVRPGEVGELLVRGPQIMLGYWNDSTATKLAIRDGWLYTGDLARVDEDGFYQIKERKKDLIITSGYNVYPVEVERVLCTCPGVKEAAVIGIPDAARGEIVKAYVVMDDGAAWDESKLETHCRADLAAHKRPRSFEQCESDLPRNFLGKVQRRQLRDRQLEDRQLQASDDSSGQESCLGGTCDD